jgi:aarF domain-containing kinase
LGPDWEINFSRFDSIPIAAASIGQVHAAILKSGEKVAVKIQYPGVSKSIDSDLDNLMMLLNFSNFLPKGLYLDNSVRVARKELQMECDYIREAACMDRFSDLITKYQLTHFKVPKVYKHLSTGQVLITEYVNGYTIDQATALPQKDRDLIGKQLLELCLKELFVFQFMQTDPNFGNFLYDRHTRKINLLDFGAAREYSKSFTDNYLQLLKAGKDQNKKSAIEFSIKLGFLSGFESEKMLNAHVNSLFLLAKPFNEAGYYDFGSSKSVTDGVRDDIPVMLNERLKPPPDETYSLHRKLSGCFLLCSKLSSRVDCQAEFNKIFNEYRFQEAD